MFGNGSWTARIAGGGLLLLGAATCMDFGFPACRIRCERDMDCPSNLLCSEVGLCGGALTACGAANGDRRDAGVLEVPDAQGPNGMASDAAPQPLGGGAGPRGRDAYVAEPGLDAAAGGVDARGCDATTSALEQICLADACLQLSTAMRDSLVLWLDPTTLGEPGTPVDVWCDRSGRRNHGYPGATDALSTPLLTVNDEARTVASPALQRSVWLHDNWLYLAGADETLRLGGNDFLVLLVASVLVEDDLTTPNAWGETTLFRASGVGRYALTLAAEPPPEALVRATVGRTGTPVFVEQPWDLYDSRSRLHGLRRSGSVFQYRANGVGQGNVELPPDLDLSSPENIAGFGSTNLFLSNSTLISARLTAAVIFRGPLELADVERAEGFLCGSLGGCVPARRADAGAL